MLYLQPGIHLQKIEVAGFIYNELHRARRGVTHRCRKGQRLGPHLRAQALIHKRGWSLFDNFLMTALNGALALVEMNAVAMMIRQHLDLDMPRLADKFFNEYPIIRKT